MSILHSLQSDWPFAYLLRYSVSLAVSSAVTFGLFMIMHLAIHNDDGVFVIEDPLPTIEWVNLIRETPPVEPVRETPPEIIEPPEMVEPQPVDIQIGGDPADFHMRPPPTNTRQVWVRVLLMAT